MHSLHANCMQFLYTYAMSSNSSIKSFDLLPCFICMFIHCLVMGSPFGQPVSNSKWSVGGAQHTQHTYLKVKKSNSDWCG